MKKILILCTGNSCRSIIAEALINDELGEKAKVFSSGVEASGQVNPTAKKILKINNIWRQEYHSKKLDTMLHIDFDIVVTVCDHASQKCPIFAGKARIVHQGFDDPHGGDFEAFELCYNQIKSQLVPYVKHLLI